MDAGEDVVDPAEIVRQREMGWPDFHPEAYCHRCGRRNIRAWFSPEWPDLMGSHSGILCPVCFADLDAEAVWVVTRVTLTDEAQRHLLAGMLRACTNLGDDADRVARCVLDAGFTRNSDLEPIR